MKKNHLPFSITNSVSLTKGPVVELMAVPLIPLSGGPGLNVKQTKDIKK